MINMGKCPKCNSTITAVQIEPVDIRQGFESRFHGVSYSCSSCHAVLSVSIDPLALKADTVTGVKQALRGR